MSLAELKPVVHTLPRSEKFQLMQFLVSELANEEAELVQAISNQDSFVVWTPLETHAAAQTLMHALEAEQVSA